MSYEINLIEGERGKLHVTSDDARTENVLMFGKGRKVFNIDDSFEASMTDSNTVRITSGVLYDNGMFIRINRDQFAEIKIENGLPGTYRHDLICIRYERNIQTQLESASIVVKKGEASETAAVDPEHTVGDVLDLEVHLDEFPLYRVALDGMTATLEPLFIAEDVISNMELYKDLMEHLEDVNNPAGNKHIPEGGSSGQILRWSADGEAVWGEEKHPAISKSTDSTSAVSPSAGSSFTAVDSVTRDGNGHVTKVNTKTVTLPNTDVAVDDALDSASTNPVQNKVVAEEIAGLKEEIEECGTVGILTNELETEWKVIDGTGSNNALGFSNGRFVSHGGNAFWYSDDGITWEEGTSVTGAIYSIAYGNDRFVAVSRQSSIIYYSDDGISWSPITISITPNDIAYGNGKFVIIGNTSGVMYYSTDGITWTQINPYATGYTYGTFNSVTYDEDSKNFYAVSADSNYNVRTEYCDLYYPTDTDRLYGITYGNGVLVAVDYQGNNDAGSIFYNEGGDWIKADTPDSNMYAFISTIKFGNGVFLLGTDSSCYLKSNDGKNWEEIAISYDDSYPSMQKAVYGDGRFIFDGCYKTGTNTYGSPTFSACLMYLDFKKEAVDAETVILETKEKAEEAIQKAENSLQRGDISRSTAITASGHYALDAIEKNASVEGTLANQIANIDVPVLLKEFTVADAGSSVITALSGQAIQQGRKVIIDCVFTSTSAGAIWLTGTGVLPSVSKMYTQTMPYASIAKQTASDNVHHVGLARIQDGGIVVNVVSGEVYFFHLEYVID